jgi:hypothetical protein
VAGKQPGAPNETAAAKKKRGLGMFIRARAHSSGMKPPLAPRIYRGAWSYFHRQTNTPWLPRSKEVPTRQSRDTCARNQSTYDPYKSKNALLLLQISKRELLNLARYCDVRLEILLAALSSHRVSVVA